MSGFNEWSLQWQMLRWRKTLIFGSRNTFKLVWKKNVREVIGKLSIHWWAEALFLLVHSRYKLPSCQSVFQREMPGNACWPQVIAFRNPENIYYSQTHVEGIKARVALNFWSPETIYLFGVPMWFILEMYISSTYWYSHL